MGGVKGDPAYGANGGIMPIPPAYYFLGKDIISIPRYGSEILSGITAGCKGGSRGDMGKLNMPSRSRGVWSPCPWRARSSSSSRGIVIYVRDILRGIRWMPAVLHFNSRAGVV